MEIYNDTYCIYAHINKINGKIYVGQTCRKPESRWGRDGSGYKEHPYFYHAIQKYGWDNFEHEIVASNLTKEEADNFERLLIAKLNLLNPDRGYNLQEGGSGGRMLESVKQKLRERNSGENHPMYGKHLPESTKKRISESKQGEKNNFYGKRHSEETKRKMREANSGANNSRSKKVFQYDRQEKYIREWESITSIALTYSVGQTTIMRYCQSGKLFLNEFILKFEKT